AEMAPEVLQPRLSSQVVAQISKPLSVMMPSHMATPTPTPAPLPVGAADALDASALKKKSAGPWIVAGSVVLRGGGGGVVWLSRAPEPTKPPTPPAAIATAPPTGQAVTPPPAAQPATPKAPEMDEVIVDSVPPGAKIYVDGVATADTPEAMKVEK